jgi:hypothetical protein
LAQKKYFFLKPDAKHLRSNARAYRSLELKAFFSLTLAAEHEEAAPAARSGPREHVVLMGNRKWIKDKNFIEISPELESRLIGQEHLGHTAILAAIDGEWHGNLESSGWSTAVAIVVPLTDVHLVQRQRHRILYVLGTFLPMLYK